MGDFVFNRITSATEPKSNFLNLFSCFMCATFRLLSSSIFSRLACSLFLSPSSSRTLFCSFINRPMSIAAFSIPISCGWEKIWTEMCVSHHLRPALTLRFGARPQAHLHKLNGFLCVAHFWGRDGWVVGVRLKTALIGRIPPVARMELEEDGQHGEG